MVNIEFLYSYIRKPPEGGFTINELIVLSYRIAELSQVENYHLRAAEFGMLVRMIFRKLDEPEDYPSIGRLALGTLKARLATQKLMADLADCIIARKYDDDYD